MLFNTNKGFYVKKLLTNATVGDIAGGAYEGRSHRTKVYNEVKIFSFRDLKAFDWMLVCGVTACTVLYSCYFCHSLSDFDWLGTIAVVTGIMSVVLTTNANIMNYVFGLVNVIAYAIISYKSNVLGDCLLYLLYYLPMQIVGWIFWSRHTMEENSAKVSPERMSNSSRVLTIVVSVMSVIVLGMLLSWLKSIAQEHPFIEEWRLYSEYPYRDAITTVFAIIGQYLMVRAFSEQWFFWIGVDVVSLSIWAMLAVGGANHAALMAIMYVFYLANCVNVAILWRRKTNITK